MNLDIAIIVLLSIYVALMRWYLFPIKWRRQGPRPQYSPAYGNLTAAAAGHAASYPHVGMSMPSYGFARPSAPAHAFCERREEDDDAPDEPEKRVTRPATPERRPAEAKPQAKPEAPAQLKPQAQTEAKPEPAAVAAPKPVPAPVKAAAAPVKAFPTKAAGQKGLPAGVSPQQLKDKLAVPKPAGQPVNGASRPAKPGAQQPKPAAQPVKPVSQPKPAVQPIKVAPAPKSTLLQKKPAAKPPVTNAAPQKKAAPHLAKPAPRPAKSAPAVKLARRPVKSAPQPVKPAPSAKVAPPPKAAAPAAPAKEAAQVQGVYIDKREALNLAGLVVTAITKGEAGEVYGRMGRTYRDAVTEDILGAMIEQMNATYGGSAARSPERGEAIDSGAPDAGFTIRYSVRTGSGTYPFFVQIAREGDRLVCSDFYYG